MIWWELSGLEGPPAEWYFHIGASLLAIDVAWFFAPDGRSHASTSVLLLLLQ